MFDLFSWSHILIVLVVALVVVGPKDLPKVMHTAGRWMAKARGMANEFRKSFDEMARQTELDELRKEIDQLRYERVDIHPFNPDGTPAAPADKPASQPVEAPVTEHAPSTDEVPSP